MVVSDLIDVVHLFMYYGSDPVASYFEILALDVLISR
jgi:hypothetical protein